MTVKKTLSETSVFLSSDFTKNIDLSDHAVNLNDISHYTLIPVDQAQNSLEKITECLGLFDEGVNIDWGKDIRYICLVKTRESIRDERTGLFDYKCGIIRGNETKKSDNNLNLDDKKGLLLSNFEKLSKEKQDYLLQVSNYARNENYRLPTLREPSIYDLRKEDEEIENFVRRIYLERKGKAFPSTWNKTKDGDIIAFLKEHLQQRNMNFIDGFFLTKAIIRKLNNQAANGIENWLRNKENHLENEGLVIPNKLGQSKIIVKHLTREEIKAAHSYTKYK